MSGSAEYRDPDLVRRLAAEIRRLVTRPWTLMEVCGGQTHAILRHGLERWLPPEVTLLHGPGCPVCVTPVSVLDAARRLALRPGVILASFGDMLRVPGSHGDLFSARAEGADVRVVYSPLDAVRLATAHPGREVVFFGVGFETTAPATALAVTQAAALGLRNFSLLASHRLVPPALEALLGDPLCTVQGFLAAGHVCAVTGWEAYEEIARRHRVPIVVTGFEPIDLLHGIRACIAQLEAGRATVENAYARVVRRPGNASAQRWVDSVFRVTDGAWRGFGLIPSSGLALSEALAPFDASRRFPDDLPAAEDPAECRSGWVLQGRIRPPECAAFGSRCTPEHPLGATMVSSEGACAAYFRYPQRGQQAGAGAPVRPLSAP